MERIKIVMEIESSLESPNIEASITKDGDEMVNATLLDLVAMYSAAISLKRQIENAAEKGFGVNLDGKAEKV